MEDLLYRVTLSEACEDRSQRNTRSADHGLTVADLRITGYEFVIRQHSDTGTIITVSCNS